MSDLNYSPVNVPFQVAKSAVDFDCATILSQMREVLLVYDHQCFVCDAYCRQAHIREEAGELRRVNARDASPLMEELTARGLDIDKGLVLKVDGDIYYGSDAIHELSLLSNRGNLFNRLTYWVFYSKKLAHIIYPILGFFHDLILKILRKTKINNLNLPNNGWF